MINNKQVKKLLKIEICPESKVLLLAMIMEGGVDICATQVGIKCALTEPEARMGQMELKKRKIIANGSAKDTFTVQREVVDYGSNSSMGSTRTRRTKRAASDSEKTHKENKD